jgi:hypothetical protein
MTSRIILFFINIIVKYYRTRSWKAWRVQISSNIITESNILLCKNSAIASFSCINIIKQCIFYCTPFQIGFSITFFLESCWIVYTILKCILLVYNAFKIDYTRLFMDKYVLTHLLFFIPLKSLSTLWTKHLLYVNYQSSYSKEL